MVERPEDRPPQSGGDNPDMDEQVEGHGGEGAQNAQATPPVGQDAEPGKTTSPPAEGEVGVPPDEEMNRPDD